MRGTKFAELNAFVAVAEHGNFTKAATHLNIAPATLSQTIRELEERLGVRLLNRTTRSVSLTQAGDELLARLRPLIEDFEAAIDSVQRFRDKPAGLLRIIMPPVPAMWLVAPMLPRFLEKYPEIRLEISASTELVDIVAKHFDAGIRVGELIERDMIAIKLGMLRYAVLAVPAYFTRHPRPQTPQDLQSHNCIRFRFANGALLPWRFNIDGAETEVAVGGSLIVNSVELARRALYDGIGLLYAPLDYLSDDLESGTLVQVLHNWMPAHPDGLFLFYPSRRQQRAPLKVFAEFLRANLRSGEKTGAIPSPLGREQQK